MDGFGFLFAVGIVLLVLFGPWVLLLRVNSARKRERDEDQQRWRELTSRIFTLENAVERRRPNTRRQHRLSCRVPPRRTMLGPTMSRRR
jgi:hypothetical protein